MAIRYSGDVEVRVRAHLGRDGEAHYVGGVRAPGFKRWYVLEDERRPLASVLRRIRGNPSTPEAYDAAARAVLKQALDEHPSLPVELDARGRPIVRRVFESPCPGAGGRLER